MRKVKIDNEKIQKLLAGKKDLGEDQVRLADEMTKLEEQYNANLTRMQRIDEKAKPLLKTYLSTLVLGEYEEVTKTYKGDDDAWYFDIVDRMEELKEAFKKK